MDFSLDHKFIFHSDVYLIMFDIFIHDKLLEAFMIKWLQTKGLHRRSSNVFWHTFETII
jgi:hypothetical protein